MILDIEYSIEKDARTYIDYVYNFKSFKHGNEDIQKRLLLKLAPRLQEVLITAKDDTTAYKGVFDYLTKSYNENPQLFEDSIGKLKTTWKKVGANIIYFLEFIYKKPFPFENITVYLTTNNIFPYNYEQKYFYANYKYVSSQLSTATHELNHFMFYYYYESLKDKLDNEKYELLKESLTFFSNPDREGKPNELPLRELFKSKLWENLDEAISAGAKYLLEK